MKFLTIQARIVERSSSFSWVECHDDNIYIIITNITTILLWTRIQTNIIHQNKLKSIISADNQCKFINKILNSIHEEIHTKSDRIKTFAETNERDLKNRNPRDWEKDRDSCRLAQRQCREGRRPDRSEEKLSPTRKDLHQISLVVGTRLEKQARWKPLRFRQRIAFDLMSRKKKLWERSELERCENGGWWF